MLGKTHVALLVGSLRADGWSARLARELIRLAPPYLELVDVPIRHLPLYDHDAENSPPDGHVAFRTALADADAILFVTPEYNRSVPGALKNALDVASRPYGRNVLDGKPCAVVSQSPGAVGGMAANHALRQVLMSMNMPALPCPEIYLAHSDRTLARMVALAIPAPSFS